MAWPRRIGGTDRASPNPGDRRRFAAIRKDHVGIEGANAVGRLGAHPIAVRLHVGGETPVAFPHALRSSCYGAHRRLTGESGWNLKHGALNQHGDRVEVAGVRRQAKPHRLQRYGAATTERVQHLGQFSVAGPHNLDPSFLEDALVVRRLPRNQPFEDVEEPVALALLILDRRKPVGVC